MLLRTRVLVLHTLALLIFIKVVHCLPATSSAKPDYLIGEVTEMAGTILPNNFTDIQSTIEIKQEASSSAAAIDGSEKHPILRFLAVERSSCIRL
jgi:hypothetical protein